MDFRYKHIYLYLVLVLQACTVTFEEPQPTVSSSRPIVQISTREVNYSSSDFINWDSIPFEFSHFEYREYWNYVTAVFYSTSTIRDTIAIRYDPIPYESIEEYYGGNPSMETRINRYPGAKIRSNGTGTVIYKKSGADSAYLIFDMKQNTNYRLPNNQKLTANVRGRFRIPR